MKELTATSFFNLCDKSEFISIREIMDYKTQLRSTDTTVALIKFVKSKCPNCGEEGMFKSHLFGKVKHPACNFEWYLSPGTYILNQLKKVFNSGMNLSTGIGDDQERKGEKQGFLGFIFHFLLGATFRLFFALLSIPIQIIIYLLNKKAIEKEA